MAPAERKVALAGSERRPLPGAQVIGDVDPKQRIDATVYVRRNPAAPPLPSAEELSMVPPNQRAYPSDQQIEASFGASQQDLDAVAQFARQYGLEVTEISVPKRSVHLEGPIENFVRAFGVELKRWSHERGDYRGRIGHILVPSNLQGVIESVVGLDNRRIGRSFRQSTRTPVFFRSTVTPRGFLPTQLAQLYNFPAQFDGTGQCVAILAFNGAIADTGVSAPGGFDMQVLQGYFQDTVRVNVPEIQTVVVRGPGNQPGDETDPTDSTGEIMLDLQMAGSIAPGAKLVVYFTEFTEQGWVDVLQTIVNDTQNRPSIISISYGNAETTKDGGSADQRGSLWTRAAIDKVNQAFQIAALKGITICCASGDDGSNDQVSDGFAHADFPASSPFVLGCGGTRLTSSGGVIQSETVWNDGAGSAGGGGISDLFPIPTWQQNIGVPPSVNPSHRIGRGVPDVSGLADPQTGVILADINGQVNPQALTGGTSATAPMWAALVARLNQGLGARLGFMNPLLYTRFAGGVLRDITQGNNGAFQAGPGWDACTGLGSPDGVRLLQAFGSGAGPGHALGLPAAVSADQLSALTTRIRQLELMVEALQMDRLRGHNGSVEHPVLLTSGSNL